MTLDAYDRVTGAIEYPSTVERPGMLHARVLRSPVPHALIRRIDTERGAAVPGVRAVLTAASLRDLPLAATHFGPVVRDQPIVAMDKVRYVGEPVAAVAADDLDAADEVLDLLDVTCERIPAVFDVLEARSPGAPVVHDRAGPVSMMFAEIALDQDAGSNICHHYKLRTGDVERALREADHVFEDTFTSPALQHVPLETHACVAEARPGRVTVWSGT